MADKATNDADLELIKRSVNIYYNMLLKSEMEPKTHSQ